MALLIRPLAPADAPALRELVANGFSSTPFADAAAEAVYAALSQESRENRALVAAHDGAIDGLVLFGMIAGAQGTAKLQLVVVNASSRRRGIASRLCDAATEELAGLGARLVVAEMPDQATFAPGRSLLELSGWREEARVPDYYADGVALVLLRKDSRPQAAT